MSRQRSRSFGIFADLVSAVDWYDVSLQSILETKNLPSVNRTQSVMLTHIAKGVTRPSDIALQMGTTRQNIHAMAKSLIDDRIIEVVPDPEDGRSKQYAFCEESLEFRDTVIKVFRYLDRQLANRIGRDEYKALKHALSLDWGDFIIDNPDKNSRH